MTQSERQMFLIKELLREQPQYSGVTIPSDGSGRKKLLRSLFNIRAPKPVSEEFISVQDEYLRGEIASRGITDADKLTPLQDNICLWQGDITTLKCGAIVNAANSQMLGCFCPCHGCIDNAIHTFSGIQLRLECAEIMRCQGHEEPVGKAKITAAYNLPCERIIHTVGPYVEGALTREHCARLKSCYEECLKTAAQNGVSSIAFCCISTGEFNFPNDRAAEIAVETVKEYIKKTKSKMRVIFNVFKNTDKEIYQRLLAAD